METQKKFLFCRKRDLMHRLHNYSITTEWIGNRGDGTIRYDGYDRTYTIKAQGKPAIEASSDIAFRGDKSKYNPEDLLVASISACHMLWYLHLCADAGIIVTAYSDNATGIMQEDAINGGRFTEITLYPVVTITEPAKAGLAKELHTTAHKQCFIANSVNFPVLIKPTVSPV